VRNRNFGFRYNSDTSGQYLQLVEGFGSNPVLFAMGSAFANDLRNGYFGRNTPSGQAGLSGYGEIMFPYGFFMRGNLGTGKIRKLETGDAQPTTGAFAEGDIMLNNLGNKSGCIGWRCIQAGNFLDANTANHPKFQEVHGYTKGTTANRPSALVAGDAGAQYYDTDLSKPVWWDGTAWKDATGTAV
jgi:hypothetical protein